MFRTICLLFCLLFMANICAMPPYGDDEQNGTLEKAQVLSDSDKEIIISTINSNEDAVLASFVRKLLCGPDKESRFKCLVDYRGALAKEFFLQINQMKNQMSEQMLFKKCCVVYFAYRMSYNAEADRLYLSNVLYLYSLAKKDPNVLIDTFNILKLASRIVAKEFKEFIGL